MRGAIGALAVIAVMGAARAAPAPLERRSTRGVIDQLVWLRHESAANGRVFVVTDARELLYSEDDGKTFTSLMSKLSGSTRLRAPPMLIAGASDERGAMLKSTPELILQDAMGELYWASADLGTTWTQPCGKVSHTGEEGCFKNPGEVVPGGRGRAMGAIRPHPKRAGWLLSFVRTCDAGPGPGGMACRVNRLLASGDLGKTWTDMVANSKGKVASFVDFDWAPDDGAGPYPPIYATVFRDGTKFAAYRGAWDYNIDFVRSEDLFSTHTLVEQCANAFEILNGDVYTASPPDCADYHKHGAKNHPSSEVNTNNVVLKISTNQGKSFNTACFPMNLPANAFEIYDFHADDAGPDFIAVDHIETSAIEARAPMSQLYASDESMSFFSMSMRTMVKDSGGSFVQDFAKVLGLEGVFIANQISYKAFIDGAAIRNGDYSAYYESRISFNAGGTWHKIPAPATDAEGVKYACAEDEFDCERYGLHLHGAVDWDTSEDWNGRLGGVYTRSSAPGVIISTGNVGDAVITDEPARVNTYISRDGGATWIESKKGAYIYEFGNRGGLLVVAKQFMPVDVIEYSLNEGKSWSTLKLANSIFVHNIRVDPSSKGHVFIIHGMTAESVHADPNRGSYFVVDFDEIISGGKVCGAADYEMWSPAAPGSHGCLMGQKYELKRRKLDVECFNDEDFDRAYTIVGTCECSRVFDTECDYGTERVYNVPNASQWPHCAPSDNVNTQCAALNHKPPTPSSNLRIISGDKCTSPGAALGDDGPRRRGHHRGRMFVHFIMLLAFLGVAAYGAMYVHANYDLGTLSTTVPNATRNAINGAYEKFQDTFGKREQATPPGYFEPLGDFAAEDEI